MLNENSVSEMSEYVNEATNVTSTLIFQMTSKKFMQPSYLFGKSGVSKFSCTSRIYLVSLVCISHFVSEISRSTPTCKSFYIGKLTWQY